MEQMSKENILEKMREISDKHSAIKNTITNTIEDTKKTIMAMIQKMDNLEKEYNELSEQIKKM